MSTTDARSDVLEARSPRGKRSLPAGAKCTKRQVSLPPYYEKLISERMELKGVSRSEALRHFIDEAQFHQKAQHERKVDTPIELR